MNEVKGNLDAFQIVYVYSNKVTKPLRNQKNEKLIGFVKKIQDKEKKKKFKMCIKS